MLECYWTRKRYFFYWYLSTTSFPVKEQLSGDQQSIDTTKLEEKRFQASSHFQEESVWGKTFNSIRYALSQKYSHRENCERSNSVCISARSCKQPLNMQMRVHTHTFICSSIVMRPIFADSRSKLLGSLSAKMFIVQLRLQVVPRDVGADNWIFTNTLPLWAHTHTYEAARVNRVQTHNMHICARSGTLWSRNAVQFAEIGSAHSLHLSTGRLICCNTLLSSRNWLCKGETLSWPLFIRITEVSFKLC